jgi:hypothetical protein
MIESKMTSLENEDKKMPDKIIEIPPVLPSISPINSPDRKSSK